ncbi:uncharacterized protein [Aphelocoma coerulescens]|uniref:uncharacterized protein isoform X1 n=1 Tax=Aphelocoma coerulescens TaxID=39617 RepID=UPI0036045FB4
MEQKPSTLDPLLEPEDTRWLDGKRKRKSSQCLVKSSMSGTPGSHGCLMSRPGPLEFHGHPLSPGTSLVTWTKMNSAWCAGTRPPATTTAASPVRAARDFSVGPSRRTCTPPTPVSSTRSPATSASSAASRSASPWAWPWTWCWMTRSG